MLKQKFDFLTRSGERDRRQNFIWQVVLGFIVLLAFNFASNYLPHKHDKLLFNEPLDFVILVTSVFNFYFWIGSHHVTTGRLHDLNLSGWWQIILIAPFTIIPCFGIVLGYGVKYNMMMLAIFSITSAVLLFFAFYLFLATKRGTIGPNKYGPDPLQNTLEVTHVSN